MKQQLAILIACFSVGVLGYNIDWYPKAPPGIPENRICRPTESGYYIQDPHDCQKYFACDSDGIAHEKTCAPQVYHVINDRLGECRPLKQAVCGTRRLKDETPALPTTAKNLPTLASSTDETWRTQANCVGQKNGKYNVPNQCKKILTCHEERAYLSSCPANLVFDELINTPGQEGCEYLENAKRTDCNQWNIDGERDNDADTDIEALEGYSNIQPWMNQLDCSRLQDGKHSIPNYCGVYYYCLGGRNLGTQQCAVGLAFENRHGFDGDCFFGEEVSRNDCAEKKYCEKKGAGNHYTNDHACDRYMYCSSDRGIAQPTNCPIDTIFQLINEHQGFGCVQKELSKREGCY